MSKIDLRELLNRALAANSNQLLVDPSRPDPLKPAPRSDAAPPRTVKAVRPHRALRPRRRS